MPSFSSPSLHKNITPANAREIHARRQMGMYLTDETLNELRFALDNWKPDAYAVTLIHSHGIMCDYPKADFTRQVEQWRKVGATLIQHNITPIDYRGHRFWMFIIQPPDMRDGKVPISPLALANNTFVSGYAYITAQRNIADWVMKKLTV
jgi:hypothetical protein